MEGDGNALFQGAAGGADAAGPVHAEILHMDVSPVVHMGHKEGNHGPQGRCLGQLVPAHKLAVDNHRAQVLKLRIAFLHRFQAGEELLRRCVAVAVGQQLSLFPRRLFHGLLHGLVGHGAVAPVVIAAGVGPAHPGRAALGGAVQEDFHAPDAKMPAGFAQFLPGLGVGIRVRIGHQIQL